MKPESKDFWIGFFVGLVAAFLAGLLYLLILDPILSFPYQYERFAVPGLYLLTLLTVYFKTGKKWLAAGMIVGPLLFNIIMFINLGQSCFF
jgi:hypothetical protein